MCVAKDTRHRRMKSEYNRRDGRRARSFCRALASMDLRKTAFGPQFLNRVASQDDSSARNGTFRTFRLNDGCQRDNLAAVVVVLKCHNEFDGARQDETMEIAMVRKVFGRLHKKYDG